MNVEELEEQIQRLPQQDLARLVGWLDRFLDRRAPEELAEPEELTEEEKFELLRRRGEMVASPGPGEAMDDDYFDDLKRSLADARARKASGG